MVYRKEKENKVYLDAKQLEQLLTTEKGVQALYGAYGDRSWKRAYRRLQSMAAEGRKAWVTPEIWGRLDAALGWLRKAKPRGRSGRIALKATCNGKDVTAKLGALLQTVGEAAAEFLGLLDACGI